jgi:hypothetical protein
MVLLRRQATQCQARVQPQCGLAPGRMDPTALSLTGFSKVAFSRFSRFVQSQHATNCPVVLPLSCAICVSKLAHSDGKSEPWSSLYA